MAKVTTWRNRKTGKLTNKITIRIEHRLTLAEMIDGLCSQYVRNASDDEMDALPDSLPAAEIIDTVRYQYERYGTNAVWTWGEQSGNSDMGEEWARKVIIRAFPEMGENQ